MDSIDRQVLVSVQNWAAEGHCLALVTVARTWGSAPRPMGAWLAIRDDGRVQGSVSGGCIEDDLICRMQAGELGGERPFTRVYGVSQAEAQRFGLPCGGSLELVIEPDPDLSLLAKVAERITAGQRVTRRLDLASGSVTLTETVPGDTMAWDGQQLTTLHGPVWRLLIIGAGQISRYLAEMAQALDYAVTLCDPRTSYREEWDVPGTTLTHAMPDDVVQAMIPDPHLAVVALTHDPKLDDLALLAALKSSAFYVGALGSRNNNDKRRERLLQHFDLTAEEVARLHGPVGLRIGSKTPPEIAVSILAEMTAVKHRV
ncbi:xanthine dehydrogenase accessory factor [Gammaproteobacteria bacterium]